MKQHSAVERKPTSFIKFVLLSGTFLCVASALPLLNVYSGAAQTTSASSPSVSQPNAPSETQANDTPLASFEVASIKKHPPDPPGRMFMRLGPPPGDVSHWVGSNVTAKQLIAIAYGVKDFQIQGGPSWFNSERFDVDAKVDDSVAARLGKLPVKEQQEQMALMLRPLLADRFKLQITRDATEGKLLALVVAKGGPKLKEVAPPDPNAGPPPMMSAITPGQLPTPPPGQGFMMMMNGLATLSANAVPITKLVDQLSTQLGQSVADQTGLKGTYEYTIQFAPQGGPSGMPLPVAAGAPSNSDEPSIFTALQEQLGLKLESTKGQIDTIRIDHIEEPSEN